MEDLAQEIVLDAVDQGWHGPPFDPLELANLRGLKIRPNASISDARVFPDDGGYVIEYNPNKSAGRVNFSIAHEIAHTLFEDWAEKTRNRTRHSEDEKNWQLEMLCSIGAAEILMPVGSVSHRFEAPEPIESIMRLRQEFQVSAEAMLIRMAKMAKFPMVSFAASKIRTPSGTKYRIDYSIASSSWSHGKLERLELDHSPCFDECTAIGTTARSVEKWVSDIPELTIEAVGLPPYPGSQEIRIAGFAYPREGDSALVSKIEYRQGDATKFRLPSNTAIVHVVNDKARSWGGFGFASALRSEFPAASSEYQGWVANNKSEFKLGSFHAYDVSDLISENRLIISMVAQSGYGESSKPRIRYSALHNSLDNLAAYLADREISDVQMPRIGAGQAGGDWRIIEGIIFESLVLKDINVKVYDLPPG